MCRGLPASGHEGLVWGLLYPGVNPQSAAPQEVIVVMSPQLPLVCTLPPCSSDIRPRERGKCSMEHSEAQQFPGSGHPPSSSDRRKPTEARGVEMGSAVSNTVKPSGFAAFQAACFPSPRWEETGSTTWSLPPSPEPRAFAPSSLPLLMSRNEISKKQPLASFLDYPPHGK